jgi:hypothetical protein
MLLQISRKQEFMRVMQERGDSAFEENEMSSLLPKMQNLIGKDFIL